MVDYLIVGSGIAGICFAETALQHNKTITVFENSSQNSSTIAAGIYNPVILKRFSEVWNAKQQLDFNMPFYNAVQNRIGVQIDFPLPVNRKLFSTEEQNNWFVAADKPNLSHFLSPAIFKHDYKGISASFGFGEVLHTGFVDTKLLLQKYHQYLHQENLFISETFDYTTLEINQNYI
jgi:glycine oxidase